MNTLTRQAAILGSGLAFLAGGIHFGIQEGNDAAEIVHAQARNDKNCLKWLGDKTVIASSDLSKSCYLSILNHGAEDYFGEWKSGDNFEYDREVNENNLRAFKGVINEAPDEIKARADIAHDIDANSMMLFFGASWTLLLSIGWGLNEIREASNKRTK